MYDENTLNIIYTVDDIFLPLVSVSLSSVILNNLGKKLEVYIATDKDGSTSNFNKIKNHHNQPNINIHFVDCKMYDNLLNNIRLNKWGSESYYVYWRLFVLNLINVERAIYLDADILCNSEISYIDLHSKTVGAVLDSVSSYYNHILKKDMNFKSYNTGVLFFDVKKWKEMKCSDIIVSFLNKNENNDFMLADQDIFSLCLQNHVCTIPPNYNWFAGYDYYGIDTSIKLYKLNKKSFYSSEILNDSKQNIIFYHCLDGVFGRPWQNNNFHPYKDIYRNYQIKSAWPDFCSTTYISLLFRFQKFIETILPLNLYIPIHRLAINTRIFLYSIKHR